MQPANALTPPVPGILGRIFGRKPAEAGDSRVPRQRLRSIAGSSAADRAAELLSAPSALMQLSHAEARTVVAYMRPHKIPEGQTFIREGDTDDTDFMLLLLDGEVTIETIVVSRTAPITVSVLGPGSLIGEMGLLDGAPRSASCTAMSDVRCAILTRDAMNHLLNDEPRTAAKLMMAISLRITQRMRENQDKLKLYAQLTQAMNEEINDLMPL
ncbi:Crp/Fnr family transcriptional regulator [Ramlibacter sp. WS9]|uniref:Crp/Fnr family transcriptional regulator n=1 Tax=Ramlibacter sp. WS9 TaxID=1882741 RepID=UPI0011434228|nr:cyclic nucleotide-binding domain-containing protein [Ramlibacter sp. WS9]ROZ66714.1 cyclic nucleotide-binding domain-containing protein [Ramlibacter sp. WS9]